MVRGDLTAWLKEVQLEHHNELCQLLEDLGVESLEDLKSVREDDLETLKVIPRRRFLEKQQLLKEVAVPSAGQGPVPIQTTETCECDNDTWHTIPLVSPQETPSSSFEWHMVGEEDAKDMVETDDSRQQKEPQLRAKKAQMLEVPHFTFDEGKAMFKGHQKMSARPVFDKLRPEEDWKFLTMQFPGQVCLKDLIGRYKDGFLHDDGRMYYYVSSSKSPEFPQGPTAWLVSPPGGGGPKEIDDRLGFGTSLKLDEPTEKVPFPVFRLRARVKQLFSSIIASMDASSIHVTLVKDFEDCGKVIRDDGAGEVDPDILAELAMASNTSQEDIGPSRSVVQSAQIRCAGLKGMLLGSKHLQGTRKVEVPRSMLKFGESFEGEHLHVLNFSRIRPTFLGSHLALLLEACGCDTSILIQEHVAYLKKVGNYNVSREDAFDQLRFAQRAADDADGEKEAKFTGGMRYLGTFLRMLQAGFSPQQHPLLEQVLRQKAKALLAAQRSVHIRDVWSARGHPEPGKREELQLHDNEIFLMVPCDGEETGWKALEGKVIIHYLSDRDPSALRLAVAKDSTELRAKCAPGVLYFSKQGTPLQANLGWDFDGDYFHIIAHKKLVESFKVCTSPPPEPTFQEAMDQHVPVETLVDVHTHFLTKFSDQIGLYHWKWQMHAGAGASSPPARQAAAAYSKYLDVEKGKPCPLHTERIASQQKWDFMKGGDPQKCSPTAAGECFREAAKAHKEFVAAREGIKGMDLDPDLHKAWAELKQKLGRETCQKLKSFAAIARGQLIQDIKDRCAKAENQMHTKHPFASCADDNDDADQSLAQLRSKTLQQVEQAMGKGVSLSEVALAAWHLKYVDQGVHLRANDPDPTFPWTLFAEELLGQKERQQPCLRRELHRCHLLLRKLQRGAKQAMKDEAGAEKLKELAAEIAGIPGQMKCPHCSSATADLLAQLHLEASPSEIAEAMGAISGAGKLVKVDCEELRFAKSWVNDTIEHGPQSGTKLADLVEKLEKGEEKVENLELTAVRFHGHLYVVEGNRRLWCIKELQKNLGRQVMASVRLTDLYLGFIRRQDHREPALPYFLERFQGGGLSITVMDSNSSAPASPLPEDGPSCPIHDVKMQQKRNRTTGELFWGCPNWSSKGCKETRNISQSKVGPLLVDSNCPAPALPSESPSCPIHSVKMERQVQRSTGKPFWGCPNWKKDGCKETRNIPTPA